MEIVPQGTDHRRQGWMMGLVFLSTKVEAKDPNYRRSQKLDRAYTQLREHIQEFAACILTPLNGRTAVTCNKWSENASVHFPNAVISAELKQWVAVAWPTTFVDDGKNARSVVNEEVKIQPARMTIPNLRAPLYAQPQQGQGQQAPVYSVRNAPELTLSTL